MKFFPGDYIRIKIGRNNCALVLTVEDAREGKEFDLISVLLTKGVVIQISAVPKHLELIFRGR